MYQPIQESSSKRWHLARLGQWGERLLPDTITLNYVRYSHKLHQFQYVHSVVHVQFISHRVLRVVLENHQIQVSPYYKS